MQSNHTRPDIAAPSVQQNTMRAVVYDRYGSPDVLEIREVDRPVPRDDQVLVRVHASSVNALEWHMLTGEPYLVRPTAGFRTPKRRILGADVAGVVEVAGKDVTLFQPGDQVFGDIGAGAYAEYVCASERHLAPKPTNLTFEQAATVPVAGLTALQGLRDHGQLQSGQKVLINGASGGVGTFAVQVAKALGAEVTAVCSTRNVETARSNGADHIIDYTNEDFAQAGTQYDLIFDIPGNRSVRDYKRVLAPEGTYVIVGGPKGRWLGPIPHIARAFLASLLGSRKMDAFVAHMKEEDLAALSRLLESGSLVPVVERTRPLDEVADALRYLGQGHSQGKVAITV